MSTSNQITISHSPEETQAIAAKLARSIISGTTIILLGNLGAGKTTFVQGFGQSLGVKRMISPTYVLLRQYPLKKDDLKMLYHADLYRLSNSQEVVDIGLPEIWSDPSNILLIEWPEKILPLLPDNTIKVEIKVLSDERRQIIITHLK